MTQNPLLYPPELLDYIVKKIPPEMIQVFITIWNANKNSGGITWTSLTKEISDRYLVEKALLLFETNGFVYSETSSTDRRQKHYYANGEMGIQLAKHIKNNPTKMEE